MGLLPHGRHQLHQLAQGPGGGWHAGPHGGAVCGAERRGHRVPPRPARRARRVSSVVGRSRRGGAFLLAMPALAAGHTHSAVATITWSRATLRPRATTTPARANTPQTRRDGHDHGATTCNSLAAHDHGATTITTTARRRPIADVTPAQPHFASAARRPPHDHSSDKAPPDTGLTHDHSPPTHDGAPHDHDPGPPPNHDHVARRSPPHTRAGASCGQPHRRHGKRPAGDPDRSGRGRRRLPIPWGRWTTGGVRALRELGVPVRPSSSTRVTSSRS